MGLKPKHFLIASVATAALLVPGTGGSALGAGYPPGVKNIVLVHGAFAATKASVPRS